MKLRLLFLIMINSSLVILLATSPVVSDNQPSEGLYVKFNNITIYGPYEQTETHSDFVIEAEIEIWNNQQEVYTRPSCAGELLVYTEYTTEVNQNISTELPRLYGVCSRDMDLPIEIQPYETGIYYFDTGIRYMTNLSSLPQGQYQFQPDFNDSSNVRKIYDATIQVNGEYNFTLEEPTVDWGTSSKMGNQETFSTTSQLPILISYHLFSTITIIYYIRKLNN